MSLLPQTDFTIPDETARVARAAFPKGNRYMHMRDALGPLFTDEDFADLFPHRGQRAAAPWRLALVTLMQFAENLTDRQAADACAPVWTGSTHHRCSLSLNWKTPASTSVCSPSSDSAFSMVELKPGFSIAC